MNLFPEAGKIGAGLGAGLGGILGTVSDVLSAPRRALWSLFGDTTSGNEAISNMTGEDPDSVLSHVLGFGLEALTDPLTYAGGLLGKLGGNAAGKSLSAGAMAKGPQYSEDVNKFLAPLQGPAMKMGTARTMVRDSLADTGSAEAMKALARDVPDGLEFLGHGGSAVAYKTPTGGVVRIGPKKLPDPRGMDGPGGSLEEGLNNLSTSRIDSPLVLQAARDVTAGPTRLEHLPLVETSSWRAPNAGEFQHAAVGLGQKARVSGLDPWDVAALDAWGEAVPSIANVGRTNKGHWLTHDPTAILPATGDVVERGMELGANQPGRIKSWLLEMLNGKGRLRDYLNQATSTGGAGQGIVL